MYTLTGAEQGGERPFPGPFPAITGRAMFDDIRQCFPLLGKHGIEGIPPDSISTCGSILHPSVLLGFAIREWLERTVPAPAPMRTLEMASACPVVIRSVPSSAQEWTCSSRGCAQRTPAPKDLGGAEWPYCYFLIVVDTPREATVGCFQDEGPPTPSSFSPDVPLGSASRSGNV